MPVSENLSNKSADGAFPETQLSELYGLVKNLELIQRDIDSNRRIYKVALV